MRYLITILFVVVLGVSFGFIKKHPLPVAKRNKQEYTMSVKQEGPAVINKAEFNIASNVDRSDFVSYAKTFIGTPYLYASTDPAKGFDCSGFVNYVSHHFGLKVPRSSVDFTNYGLTVNRQSAHPGDLILFTGTDTTRRIVGHIGIVTENNNGEITFIHSSSGKGKGVTISSLEGYYETRFVKVVRILS